MQTQANKRASPRTAARIPVAIDGEDVNRQPVREETVTLLVNESGALVALAAEFQLNDRARVTNQQTGASADCRIAWRSNAQMNGRWSYVIALLSSPEDFWGLNK